MPAIAIRKEILMEYKTLGRTGVKVSPISLGTDNFGAATPEDEAIRIINRALDAGINLLDTAVPLPGDTWKTIIKQLIHTFGNKPGVETSALASLD